MEIVIHIIVLSETTHTHVMFITEIINLCPYLYVLLCDLVVRLPLFCTVKSFVEVTKYLLTLPGIKGQFILSECFSQDPLENYFGQLHARGG